MSDQNCVAEAKRVCCQTPGNVPVVPDHPDAQPTRGLVVRVCRVCQARHFELTLEPGRLGIVGQRVG